MDSLDGGLSCYLFRLLQFFTLVGFWRLTVFSITLYAMTRDGFCNLRMWEIFMPLSVSLGIIWLTLTALCWIKFMREAHSGTSSIWEALANSSVGTLVTTLGAGLPFSQVVMLIVHGNTTHLEGLNYFKLYTPVIILSLGLTICFSMFSIALVDDVYSYDGYFVSGWCKYGHKDSFTGQRLSEIPRILQGIAT
eukprot:gb/GECG01005562.1/.p1 GENE.gb/GECG01005562.1/~~gb/GECG01005562.1/.p1  ORF type:complete len:193 (+),score=1.57 gb/GECG01005562.1/:1-579(+)